MPLALNWAGEISEYEWGVATYNPRRTHDVTLFILNHRQPAASARRGALPGGAAASHRLALIRKHPFPPDVWRPPGGGVKPGEDVVEAVVREAFEETGAEIELDRYLVATAAVFTHRGARLDWATHVFSALTETEELVAWDTDEIAAVRWGTLDELAGPLRERLLATGRAFWRYRVALHDAALAALGR